MRFRFWKKNHFQYGDHNRPCTCHGPGDDWYEIQERHPSLLDELHDAGIIKSQPDGTDAITTTMNNGTTTWVQSINIYACYYCGLELDECDCGGLE